MSVCTSRSGLRRLRRAPAVISLAMAMALAGCSIWDLGPAPDTFVGPSRTGAVQPPTDANLQAVLPVVPGDKPGGGADLPVTSMPAVPLPATTATAPQANATAPTPPPEALSVQDAILVGLENNISLRVQRYNVPISRTAQEQALAAFDPDVSGAIQGGRTASSLGSGFRTQTTDAVQANGQITEFLPTGTTITGTATTSNNFYSESSSNVSASLTVSQSLLRGAGLNVNLAALRQAELATKISQYQLRGVSESLVATIETNYWNLAYAERQVVIVENALKVAQAQLDQTNAEIQAGRLAPSENAAAAAQVAVENEDLINAKSQLDTARLTFMQAITPEHKEFWNRPVKLSTLPFIPPGTLDPIGQHVAVAMHLRPDINETRLQIQSDTLSIVRTKNGLLPRLDLFATLGKSTFASTFGSSITELNGPDYEAILGVQGDWSPINRAAGAAYEASKLTRDQEEESLQNLMQVDELDVRNQYIEVMRTLAQIPASRATREAQEVSFTTEQQKMLNGRSTAILVAAAQQNLLASQLDELNAVTAHLKALVSLYQLEGSLLLRRGIEAPGAAPPPYPAWKK